MNNNFTIRFPKREKEFIDRQMSSDNKTSQIRSLSQNREQLHSRKGVINVKAVLKYTAALFLACMLIALAGLPVYADQETGSIEIYDIQRDENNNITYDAYRIFDMTTTGDKDISNNKYTSVAYTVNSAWEAFFRDDTEAGGAQYLLTDTNGNRLDPIAFDGATWYINITETNVAEFAKKAFEYSQKNNIAATISGNTTGLFNDLALGYYMVYPKGATIHKGDFTSIVSLTSTEPNVKIRQKAEFPSITKTAADQSVQLGQVIPWTIKGKVPDTTGFTRYDYIITDTTSEGLTFDGTDTIKVMIGAEDVTDDCEISTTTGDFSVKIPVIGQTYGADITVTYTTTVNAQAVGAISKNNATLTYSNDPKNTSGTTTTPVSEDKVFSSKLTIDKYGKNGVSLEGVKFVLKCVSVAEASAQVDDENPVLAAAAAGKYYKTQDGKVTWVDDQSQAEVFITNAAGQAEISGLENGDYELIEIETIPGYNILTSPVPVTISGDTRNVSNLTYLESIENKTGALLPSTGGMGTTILYVAGSILIMAAGVILVTRRRVGE
ncbi:MAG: isopeptide-forming domain-containing fimbrial protein [Eubacterium sp.]|nr:isopeptide-forming domain-containing fimbrial protein [Eubacterium sp.]